MAPTAEWVTVHGTPSASGKACAPCCRVRPLRVGFKREEETEGGPSECLLKQHVTSTLASGGPRPLLILGRASLTEAEAWRHQGTVQPTVGHPGLQNAIFC